MNSMFSLEGKVAIVTGASAWTGKTIALEMAKAGADVSVCARTADAVAATASQIRGLGRRSIAVPTDVRVTEQVENLIAQTLNTFGRIDILVNNVGASFISSALKLSEGGWDALVRENLKPTFMCSKAVVSSMIQQGGGCIINIASTEAFRAAATNPAYSASKAAVLNLTMSLAAEWATYNIRVNAVAPGFIDMGRLENAVTETPSLKRQYEGIPLKRAAKPDEIAGAVIFLASAAGGYCTGTTVVVDGGLTVKLG